MSEMSIFSENEHKTIIAAIIAHASQTPKKKAVCFKGEDLTYHVLLDYVRKGALFLEQNGIRRGCVVAISALSKPEFVVFYLATQYIGATVIPVDKTATAETIRKIISYAQVEFLITDNTSVYECKKISLRYGYKEIKEGVIKEESFFEYLMPDMASIAEIIFTTGTTGEPKGAMLSFDNILAGTINTRDGVRRQSYDIELLPLPLNHSFGLRILRTTLYIGATLVLQNGFLFPKEMKQNIENYSCTGISIVPASVEKLYRNLGEDFSKTFSRFTHMEISAGSLSIKMKKTLLEILPDTQIYNVWGSSETGGVIFLNVTEDREHIGSLGRPANGVVVRIVSDNGMLTTATSESEAGRLVMKGRMQMQGYCGMPELTKETIIDGYLYTSDIAYLTEDGFVYMLGRVDDIINVGGEKVSPVEVENTALLFDGIKECACIAVEDKEDTFGHIPVLFVVLESGVDENDIMRFLSSKMEQYKIPKKILTIESLPRNKMMKIDRKKLKRIYDGEGEYIKNAVIDAIKGRRSIRKFNDRPIPKEILEILVECGKYAPSGHNMQTWHFSVITNWNCIQDLKNTIPPVAKKNNVYFYGFENPNAIILISNDRRNPYGIQDSSCAAQNIMLAAHSLGLGSVWLNPLMKICDEPEIRIMLTKYGVPENYNVWAMIALGYPAIRPDPLAKKQYVENWVE